MPREPKNLTLNSAPFSWELDFCATVKKRNRKSYLSLWRKNETLQRFFSGLRVSVNGKSHIISKEKCIQNANSMTQKKASIIFKKMCEVNPQIKAYFLGEEACLGESGESSKCSPQEQFDHFVFFMVQRSKFARKVWDVSNDNLMKTFFALSEERQIKTIKKLFKKYVVRRFRTLLKEFIEKINTTRLLNEILSILNALKFKDKSYDLGVKETKEILIQAIQKKLLESECAHVESVPVDSIRTVVCEDKDEPINYSRIKDEKEIKSTWNCNREFRLYFSGCGLPLKANAGDNTLYKIDLAKCIENFKIACSGSMQAIVLFMYEKNAELRDYILGEKVVLHGEAHVNTDEEHLKCFLSLLKSRAYGVVSQVWTDKYAERIITIIDNLAPALQEKTLHSMLSTKFVCAIGYIERVIAAINHVGFLDKMLRVLQCKLTYGYTDYVNASCRKVIEMVCNRKSELLAAAQPIVQVSSPVRSKWQSQPTRAEVKQPGAISHQVLSNSKHLGVSLQWELAKTNPEQTEDKELDALLFEPLSSPSW